MSRILDFFAPLGNTTVKLYLSTPSTNQITPALSALNEKFLRLEAELSGLRTEVESDQNRFENVRQDNSNKFRSIREELKSLSIKAGFQIDAHWYDSERLPLPKVSDFEGVFQSFTHVRHLASI